MLLAAVLVNTAHAALEDRERAFNGVRVNGSVLEVHILIGRVGSGAMLCELATDLAAHLDFVGHQARFTADVGKHDGVDFISGSAGELEPTALAALAVHQCKDTMLADATLTSSALADLNDMCVPRNASSFGLRRKVLKAVKKLNVYEADARLQCNFALAAHDSIIASLCIMFMIMSRLRKILCISKLWAPSPASGGCHPGGGAFGTKCKGGGGVIRNNQPRTSRWVNWRVNRPICP